MKQHWPVRKIAVLLHGRGQRRVRFQAAHVLVAHDLVWRHAHDGRHLQRNVGIADVGAFGQRAAPLVGHVLREPQVDDAAQAQRPVQVVCDPA